MNNAIRIQGLNETETKVARRMLDMTIGATTTILGVSVTRWSEETFEIQTWGRYSEKVDEAAINLVASL